MIIYSFQTFLKFVKLNKVINTSLKPTLDLNVSMLLSILTNTYSSSVYTLINPWYNPDNFYVKTVYFYIPVYTLSKKGENF